MCFLNIIKKELFMTLTKAELDEIIATETKLVLVDFYATWCGPCMMTLKYMDEEYIPEVGDQVRIIKLDVQENEELKNAYALRSIPALYLYKDGVLVEENTIHKGNMLEVTKSHLA
jgi:thioredoxin 1